MQDSDRDKYICGSIEMKRVMNTQAQIVSKIERPYQKLEEKGEYTIPQEERKKREVKNNE